MLQALGVLAAMLAVHEAGHFVVARLQGIHVDAFAIGVGPKLFRIKVSSHNCWCSSYRGFALRCGEDLLTTRAMPSSLALCVTIVSTAG